MAENISQVSAVYRKISEKLIVTTVLLKPKALNLSCAISKLCSSVNSFCDEQNSY